MFDKMKGLFEMQKKMQEVKRELDNTNFDIQSSDGLVKITMNGSQEVKEIIIKDNLGESEKTRLASSLKDAFNRSIKRWGIFLFQSVTHSAQSKNPQCAGLLKSH